MPPDADVRIHVQPMTPTLATSARGLRVAPGQDDYVGDPAFNLDDAQRDPRSEAMAILAGDDVIGFYRLDLAANAVAGHGFAVAAMGVRAFLIDAGRQGRGHGTSAARAMCDDVRARHPHTRLLVLAVNCSNLVAIAAYLKAGFVDSGEVSPGGRAGTQRLMLCDLHAAGMGN